jgi:phospho-N-acetylmuramoyl-pentapeptide-transferase
MLDFLVSRYLDSLEAAGLGFLRVFTFVTFQTLAAAVVSFVIVLALGPRTIAWLRRQKIGDNPSFDDPTMDKAMLQKKGTPTMGGLLIVAAISVTILLLADLKVWYTWIALFCVLSMGAIGAVDDWMKLRKHRLAMEGKTQATRQGLSTYQKLAIQLSICALIGLVTHHLGAGNPSAQSLMIPGLKDFIFPLGVVGFTLLTVLVLTGATNAVNLTDGLDGLAAGCGAIAAFSFVMLSLVVGDDGLSKLLLYHHIPDAKSMAVVSAAIGGACLGFLWFNAHPASVFMGDTGSLAIGALLGYIAIVTRQELLLAVIGGVFVAEALSVMLQVGYFKYTRKRTGTGVRLFLMSPLHHHFQKKGWSETQVVVRFWLIAAMLAAVGVATLKLR